MSRHTMQCWLVRDQHGQPWNDHDDEHYPTHSSAAAGIQKIRREPVDQSALLGDGMTAGPPAGEMARRRAERQAGLEAVPAPGRCELVTCDGCGAGPEDDEVTGTVHFAPGTFVPGDWDFTTDDVLDYCGSCPPATCTPWSRPIPGDQVLPFGDLIGMSA